MICEVCKKYDGYLTTISKQYGVNNMDSLCICNYCRDYSYMNGEVFLKIFSAYQFDWREMLDYFGGSKILVENPNQLKGLNLEAVEMKKYIKEQMYATIVEEE